MDAFESKRFAETLKKEKGLRNEWKKHDKMQQVFDPSSDEMCRLRRASDSLAGLDAPEGTAKGSRRQQLVQLRNELRATLADVDAELGGQA
jgi:hypothetical protein